jgi:hypothetical protein
VCSEKKSFRRAEDLKWVRFLSRSLLTGVAGAGHVLVLYREIYEIYERQRFTFVEPNKKRKWLKLLRM